MGTKIKIILKTKKREKNRIDYRASIETFMKNIAKMEGYTYGDDEQVKEVIRRTLKAEKPLPQHVEEIARSVVNQIFTWFNTYKIDKAIASMRVNIDKHSDITIYAEVYYWLQGIAELVAIFHGPDGFTPWSWHKVWKIVVMLDYDLKYYTDLLMKEMLNVARYAYNIYVEKKDVNSTGH